MVVEQRQVIIKNIGIAICCERIPLSLILLLLRWPIAWIEKYFLDILGAMVSILPAFRCSQEHKREPRAIRGRARRCDRGRTLHLKSLTLRKGREDAVSRMSRKPEDLPELFGDDCVDGGVSGT